MRSRSNFGGALSRCGQGSDVNWIRRKKKDFAVSKCVEEHAGETQAGWKMAGTHLLVLHLATLVLSTSRSRFAGRVPTAARKTNSSKSRCDDEGHLPRNTRRKRKKLRGTTRKYRVDPEVA